MTVLKLNASEKPNAYIFYTGEVVVLSYITRLSKFEYGAFDGNDVQREWATRGKFEVGLSSGFIPLSADGTNNLRRLEDDYRNIRSLLGVPVPEREHEWADPEPGSAAHRRGRGRACSRCGEAEYASHGTKECKALS